MFFAEHVPAEHLITVLGERAEQLEDWMKQTTDWLGSEAQAQGTPGKAFISHYALAVMKAEIAFLSEELPKLREALTQSQADPVCAEPKRKESVE